MTDVDKIKEELAELKRKTLEKEKQIEEAMAASLHDLADKFSMMAREAGFTGATADFADILKGRKADTTKSKTATTGPSEMHYDDKGVGYKIGPSGRIEWAKFLTPDGTQHIRKPRAKGKTWSKTQEKEYMQAFIKKHGK